MIAKNLIKPLILERIVARSVRVSGILAASAIFFPASLLAQPKSSPSSTSGTWRDSKPENKRTNRKIDKLVFQPRGTEGKPLETVGAGTRTADRCLSTPPDSRNATAKTEPLGLTLVVPQGNENLTINARPTFWFYLPQTQSKTLEFSLFEKTPNVLGEYKTGIYQVSLPIDRQGIVTSYTLPANAPALNSGKTYEWAIALVCDPNNRQRDLNASSVIMRVELSAEMLNDIKQTPVLEQADIFAQMGIWSDLLTSLVTSLSASPNPTQKLWQDLLRSDSVKLEKIADQPLTVSKIK
jgi:hypothetical protein